MDRVLEAEAETGVEIAGGRTMAVRRYGRIAARAGPRTLDGGSTNALTAGAVLPALAAGAVRLV